MALFLSGIIGGCFFPYYLLPHNKTLILGKISPTFQTCNFLTLKRIKDNFFRSGTTLKRWFGEHLLNFFWKILGKKKLFSNCRIVKLLLKIIFLVFSGNFLGSFWIFCLVFIILFTYYLPFYENCYIVHLLVQKEDLEKPSDSFHKIISFRISKKKS